MFIGRVIAKNKRIEVPEIIEVSTDTSLAMAYDMPVLIVGKKLAEEIFGPEKIKVLDRTIDKEHDISWTYGKTEKRSEYEKDIVKYTKRILKKVTDRNEYRYFDILTVPCKTIKSFIRYMNSACEKIIYFNGKHFYIYDRRGVIYGISKDQLEYINISIKKIIKKFVKNNNIYINNNDFITNDLKKYIKSLEIETPFLYSLLFR